MHDLSWPLRRWLYKNKNKFARCVLRVLRLRNLLLRKLHVGLWPSPKNKFSCVCLCVKRTEWCEFWSIFLVFPVALPRLQIPVPETEPGRKRERERDLLIVLKVGSHYWCMHALKFCVSPNERAQNFVFPQKKRFKILCFPKTKGSKFCILYVSAILANEVMQQYTGYRNDVNF